MPSEADTVKLPAPVPPDIQALILLEARLADTHDYPAWEALWDDEAFYWVPREPERRVDEQVSYIADNRRRIASRIAQLMTGRRHAQVPPSRMRRQLTNFEQLGIDGDGVVEVACNFALYEHRIETTVWAGRYRYGIVRRPQGNRLRFKIVELVNAHGPLPTFAFLI